MSQPRLSSSPEWEPSDQPVDRPPTGAGDLVDPLADSIPQTELGLLLKAARAEIIASGQALLTREDLEREIAERRGGYDGRGE